MAEFPELGAHCAAEGCGQLDFLPLRCRTCERAFCSHHFRSAGHGCAAGADRTNCPLCGEVIALTAGASGDDAVAAIERHTAAGCSAIPRTQTHACSASGCTRRSSLRLLCYSCHLPVCIEHRAERDHGCVSLGLAKGPPGARADGPFRLIVPDGQIDLASYIKAPRVLNAASGSAAELVARARTLVLSDTDATLLVHLPLTREVTLHSMLVAGGGDGSAPRAIKVFVNSPALDFADAESLTPAAAAELAHDAALGARAFRLEATKPGMLRRVRHVTVYIADNQVGHETTSLARISLFGTVV